MSPPTSSVLFSNNNPSLLRLLYVFGKRLYADMHRLPAGNDLRARVPVSPLRSVDADPSPKRVSAFPRVTQCFTPNVVLTRTPGGHVELFLGMRKLELKV